jgi:hypothetical protein
MPEYQMADPSAKIIAHREVRVAPSRVGVNPCYSHPSSAIPNPYPLYLRVRPCRGSTVTVGASCQFPAHAPQQGLASLDHLVGANENYIGDCDPEGFCGLEVHDQLEPRGALDGEVGRFGAT